MPDRLHIYRRYLPHWRLDGAVYFITWRLERDQPALTVIERDQLVEILRRFDGSRYDLFAYVVMDDHVHALVEPYAAFPLERLVHSWKSYSTWLLQRGSRPGRIWQRE
jgi:REP element-mobilizing transposase RayT